MSKPTTTVKDRWNEKAYDQMPIRVPKGRKDDIKAFAEGAGLSVNDFVTSMIREKMGMTEDEWKAKPAEE